MASSTEIEDFLTGPLVSWLVSCLDGSERQIDYNDLVDGLMIHQVLLQIDPEPMHRGIVPSMGNSTVRVKNLDIIIKNIKCLYEEELCQVLLVMPDCVTLGNDPESKAGIENMQLLLLLLLGCAVQCPNKKGFIEGIKQMNVEEQHSIVDCIKQVTDSHEIVLTRELSDAFSADLMVNHIRRLVRERDEYLQHWAGTVTRDGSDMQRKMSAAQILGGGGNQHHLAVELADWKSRLRKQRQELEEKSEALAECREELELNGGVISRLRQEVQELMQEARTAKAYRDELDAVRERAERVDKLEAEVQRYREKLSDIEFYKTRVEELREDNKVLLDTREMLEEQLLRARRRGDHVLELESDLLKFKQHVNELTLDREAAQEKLQELFEENAQLQLVAKSAVSGHSSLVEIDSDGCDKPSGGDNSLSEQFTSNAEARALKLELENRRLVSTIDSLKEERFHDSSNKILDLEKEKKKLSIKLEQMQDTSQRMTQQNSELEQMFKDAMDENRKLHDSMDVLKANGDRLENEVQTSRSKLEELETGAESTAKEKQRLQLLMEGMQRRMEEQERAATQAETWKTEALFLPELRAQCSSALSKVEALEREREGSQRDMTKLRDILERKDVELDQYYADEQTTVDEISRLTRELDEFGTQIVKLQEIERESQELVSRAAVDKETLVTLQSDLVAQKLSNEQYKRVLEKLGLSLDELVDADTALDRIASNPEVLRLVRELISREESQKTSSEIESPLNAAECDALQRQCEEMRAEMTAVQGSADNLRAENASLEVNVAMLQSQISSLTSQHLALQLANSQLVAEKDELSKERSLHQSSHEQLLLDQVTLQTLHEQLSSEYEAMSGERESLKTMLRDARSELRTFRELCTRQEATQAILEQEKERLKTESRSLANLRAEHSSLKDDFRNLFTASEKLKADYRSLQEEYRLLRGENGSLKLRHTELQGEMASRGDRATMLEVELSKLNNRCEMLSQMNVGLEDDRRSLMEHVSLLLTQYHELLTHSLEDKEHYHMEEKLFTDKVNNLCRQKEKLEEKIMEHYRKMDSCSTKKKSFGATLVKRVRKAGSDLISKVPRSRRSSWLEDSQQDPQRSASHATLSHAGSESGGNDSDTSVDEMRRDGFARSSISLGSTGTRRAVYFTEEEENAEATQDGAPEDKPAPGASTPLQENKPFLVYNRISISGGNGVGESMNLSSQMAREAPTQGPPSPSLSSHSLSKLQGDDKPKGKGKGENSIWYEYGCV